MKKLKKADEKNSLEQLLLRWKRYFDENKTKTLQSVVVFLVVVVAVLLFRSGAFKGSNKNDFVDETYYAATQASFEGASAPDADAFAVAGEAYKNTAAGDVLYVDAAESFVRRGNQEVTRKQRYSAGTKLEEGEKLPDPKESYNSAIANFEKAASSRDPEIKARAVYGEGVAQEALASVSDSDDAVVAALNAAKACYESVVSDSSNSPYASLAKERLGKVASEQTINYYKAIAHAFVTLPDPADAPSITSGDNTLETGSPVNVDKEFQLNNDEAETEKADSAEASSEEATPSEPSEGEQASDAEKPAE